MVDASLASCPTSNLFALLVKSAVESDREFELKLLGIIPNESVGVAGALPADGDEFLRCRLVRY